jgi:hypothetical protein
MDVNSGGSKVSEGMSNKDNCGAAGTKELKILPTNCKAFIFIWVSPQQAFSYPMN